MPPLQTVTGNSNSNSNSNSSFIRISSGTTASHDMIHTHSSTSGSSSYEGSGQFSTSIGPSSSLLQLNRNMDPIFTTTASPTTPVVVSSSSILQDNDDDEDDDAVRDSAPHASSSLLPHPPTRRQSPWSTRKKRLPVMTTKTKSTTTTTANPSSSSGRTSKRGPRFFGKQTRRWSFQALPNNKDTKDDHDDTKCLDETNQHDKRKDDPQDFHDETDKDLLNMTMETVLDDDDDDCTADLQRWKQETQHQLQQLKNLQENCATTRTRNDQEEDDLEHIVLSLSSSASSIPMTASTAASSSSSLSSSYTSFASRGDKTPTSKPSQTAQDDFMNPKVDAIGPILQSLQELESARSLLRPAPKLTATRSLPPLVTRSTPTSSSTVDTPAVASKPQTVPRSNKSSSSKPPPSPLVTKQKHTKRRSAVAAASGQTNKTTMGHSLCGGGEGSNLSSDTMTPGRGDSTTDPQCAMCEEDLLDSLIHQIAQSFPEETSKDADTLPLQGTAKQTCSTTRSSSSSSASVSLLRSPPSSGSVSLSTLEGPVWKKRLQQQQRHAQTLIPPPPPPPRQEQRETNQNDKHHPKQAAPKHDGPEQERRRRCAMDPPEQQQASSCKTGDIVETEPSRPVESTSTAIPKVQVHVLNQDTAPTFYQAVANRNSNNNETKPTAAASRNKKVPTEELDSTVLLELMEYPQFVYTTDRTKGTKNVSHDQERPAVTGGAGRFHTDDSMVSSMSGTLSFTNPNMSGMHNLVNSSRNHSRRFVASAARRRTTATQQWLEKLITVVCFLDNDEDRKCLADSLNDLNCGEDNTAEDHQDPSTSTRQITSVPQ